jgi:hypothetical protein
MSVETSLKPAFHAARPRVLFMTDQSFLVSFLPWTSYAVMPDGQRFVFIKLSQRNPVTQVILVQNWFEELKRLCPIKK